MSASYVSGGVRRREGTGIVGADHGGFFREFFQEAFVFVSVEVKV